MARRDSLILGTSVVSGITMRRESLVGGGCGGGDSRRNSLILPDYYGRSSIPVMEVEPWELSHNVQEVGHDIINEPKINCAIIFRLSTNCLRDNLC